MDSMLAPRATASSIREVFAAGVLAVTMSFFACDMWRPVGGALELTETKFFSDG